VVGGVPLVHGEGSRGAVTSHLLSEALKGKGGEISASHIIPFIIGENEDCIQTSLYLQRKGFYCLPVRPPTVPKGTARIRFSLTADITEEEMRRTFWLPVRKSVSGPRRITCNRIPII